MRMDEEVQPMSEMQKLFSFLVLRGAKVETTENPVLLKNLMMLKKSWFDYSAML